MPASLVAVLLVFFGETFSIGAELVASKRVAAYGADYLYIFLWMFIPIVAGYILGYLHLKNIWIIAAISIGSILVVEPILAFLLFRQLPTFGACGWPALRHPRHAGGAFPVMLRVIIFDYDGVFFPDEYAGIRSLCPDEVALETIEKRYYDKPTSEQFWNDVRKYFSLTESDAQLRELYNAENAAQQAHETEMRRYAKLLSRTYRLALLSNQTSDRTAYLRATKDWSAFEQLFFSSDIGLAKPQKEIFDFVIKKLKVKPQECQFIDDAAENVAAAQQAGMSSMQYQSLSQFKKDLEDKGVLR